MSGRDANRYTWAETGGREMLRALRETAGLSQWELALRLSDAGVPSDQSHVNKIESGAIKRPTAQTIDAILTVGLNVPYRVRIDVLAAFGYQLRWELPTEQDIETERRINADELTQTIWPSYIADYAHRIWAWNRLFPRLLGTTADDPGNAAYAGLTVLDILFNPEIGTNRQIANAESFAPVATAWYKVMTRQYREAPWFQDLMTRARDWPGFFELWNQIPEGPQVMLVQPPVIPVEIQVPGLTTPLRFRNIHVRVGFDPRFEIVHLVPLTVETQAICAAWAAEEQDGVASDAAMPVGRAAGAAS